MDLTPCSQEPHQISQHSTSTYASTYRSAKHSFNSCLPQDVVLKYTQYCTSIAVDRQFCRVSKCQKDDNTNPGSQRWALFMSMLPITQRHQILSLSKIVHARLRNKVWYGQSYQGLRQLVCLMGMVRFMQIIHTKIPPARGVENFRQTGQGNASRVISAAELH